MVIFIDDDEAYLQWIDQNPSGFVVNAQRRPTPAYLMLHRATCPHISSDKRENWTTNQYIKVCSNNSEQLHSWAQCDVGGALRESCFCFRTQGSQSQVATAQLDLPLKRGSMGGQTWPIWRSTTELARIENLVPLKASWEKSTDPSQIRLREYRTFVRDALLANLGHDCLYLTLLVGMPTTIDLLRGNDLENYLTPLFECGCLPASQFRLVTSEKSAGVTSSLALGIAEMDNAPASFDGCCHFSICPTTLPSNDHEFKQELRDAVAACGHPLLPEGEVEMHVAWRCAHGRRSWFRLWKATGDAMGPILGDYQRKNRFDPMDDRITKLGFQFVPDESMGKRVEIGMWWRLR